MVRRHYEQNNMNEIIFGNIRDEIDPNSLREFTAIAYRCVKRDHEECPLMNEIVGALEDALRYQTTGPPVAANIQNHSSSSSQTFSGEGEPPLSASSIKSHTSGIGNSLHDKPHKDDQRRWNTVDGKEFFRHVRSRLLYEQFSAFLANVKELNSQKQSKEETLRKADEIFGPDNKDLYAMFEELASRHNS